MYERQSGYQDDGAVLSALVRVGKVTAVNTAKRIAQVQYEDMDLPSGWLQVLVTGGELPKVNEQVLVLYEPIRDGRGFILGGIQPWR